MRPIQKITCLLVLLVSSLSFAQTGVTVTYYTGSTQDFNISSAGKLYFSSDNLYVQTDGSATPTTIPVSIIRKITFSTALATPTFGDNRHNIVLYPNPGSDNIKIKADNAGDLKVEIYSLYGQLVKQGIYQSNEDIDISSLSAGLYLVQVNGVTIKFSKK